MTVYGIYLWDMAIYTGYPQETFLMICENEEIAKAYCKQYAEKAYEELKKEFEDDAEAEIRFSKYTLTDDFLMPKIHDYEEEAHGYAVVEFVNVSEPFDGGDPYVDERCETAYVYKPLEVATSLPTESR